MSIRTDRISEQLLSFLGSEIRLLKDPRAEFITLTDVSVSSDLKRAHIFWTKISGTVSPEPSIDGLGFPDDKEIADVTEALNHSANFLKKKIGRELQLRHTPNLVFVYDESLKRATRLDSLLKQTRS